MQRIINILVNSILISTVLTGCGTNYRTRSVVNTSRDDKFGWEKRSKKPWATEFLEKRRFINPYTYGPDGGSSNQSYYFLAYGAIKSTNGSSQNLLLAAHFRNEMQNAVLSAARQESASHFARVMADENLSNVVLGLATLGLSGGASVAGGTTGRALAAAAAGSEGARGLLNDEIFRGAFIESIIRLCQISQEEHLNYIRGKQTLGILEYGLEEAISDIREYENRGSFYNGLALLKDAVQKDVITRDGKTISSPERESRLLVSTTNQFVMSNEPVITNYSNTIGFSGYGLERITDSTNVVIQIEPPDSQFGVASKTLRLVSPGTLKMDFAVTNIPSSATNLVFSLQYSSQGRLVQSPPFPIRISRGQ